MKKNSIIFFACLILFACNDDEIKNPVACEVENPIEELAWLNTLVTDTTTQNFSSNYKIYQVKKDGQTYIIPYFCCIACNYVISVLDCNGNSVGFLGELLSFEEAIRPENLIWEPSQFTCIDE